MSLQSLVLSKDPEVVRQVRVILHDIGVGMETCGDIQEALARLERRKYELAVLDCRSREAAAEMLGAMRSSRSNRFTVACLIGLPPSEIDRASELGTDFVLPCPFSLEEAWRSFRSARALMEREQRRYHRARVSLPVSIVLQDSREIEGVLEDLSVSGMKLRTAIPLSPAARVEFRFLLPGHDSPIAGKAEVVWSNEVHESGMSLSEVPPEAIAAIERFVFHHCDQDWSGATALTPGKASGPEERSSLFGQRELP